MNFLFKSDKTKSIQGHKNIQKLVQDTNYVNQIFYSTLSTLEQILLFCQNRHDPQHYNNKMFSRYETVDYHSKSLKELKSQLNTQVFLLLFSRRTFAKQFPEEKWKLPNNFDERKVQQFLGHAFNIFKQHKDEQSLQMSHDILKIMRGQLNNIFSEKNVINVQYSESQTLKMKGQILKQGIHAQGEIEKRAKEVEHIKDVSDLKAKINQKNSAFRTQNEPMDIEDNSCKQYYLVFKTQMTKDKLENKFYYDPYIQKYQNSAECKFYGTQKDLFYDHKQLIYQGYTFVARIFVDKYGKIQGVKQISQIKMQERWQE